MHQRHEKTLPETETNSKFAPKNRPGPRRKAFIFQLIFRAELLVLGRSSSPHPIQEIEIGICWAGFTEKIDISLKAAGESHKHCSFFQESNQTINLPQE